MSPPSADEHSRYYVPECTSASLSGAAIFAAAYNVYKNYPEWLKYANNLKTRTENAWQRASINKNTFTIF